MPDAGTRSPFVNTSVASGAAAAGEAAGAAAAGEAAGAAAAGAGGIAGSAGTPGACDPCAGWAGSGGGVHPPAACSAPVAGDATTPELERAAGMNVRSSMPRSLASDGNVSRAARGVASSARRA
ncbi:hypothetical protein GCM10025870_25610 [Agromyces marinus]|uniref:Uncharacterized protein n=1 Tax=Agromyces marinus TaxID=1389020 RepID=A0ABM8H3W0_9MICO|nr:hypothetical protein GCM10025870_25610 [Agromyces marinus]